jgi:hypothetical protein
LYPDARWDTFTRLSKTELAESADKNKLSTVLGEAVRALLVSVGMVIALMTVLKLFSTH